MSSSPNAWKVPTHISIAASALLTESRSRISSAALLEKVRARIEKPARLAVIQQVLDAMDERARLSGARAGLDQERAAAPRSTASSWPTENPGYKLGLGLAGRSLPQGR